MKTNSINIASWKLLPLLSLFCIPTIVGCSQDSDSVFSPAVGTEHPDDSGNGTGGAPVAIGVKVDGVDDYFGGAVTRSGGIVEETLQPLDSTRDTGYCLKTVVEALPPADPVKTRGALANVQFRVVAYKGASISSSGNYAGTAVFQTNGSGVATLVGTPSPNSNGLWVLAPGTYSFVCYSLGTNADPGVLTSNWTYSVSHNQDFMTCHKNNVAVSADSNGQYMLSGIDFTRQCAQLQVVLKSEALSNNTISACAATVSGLNSSPLSWNASQTGLTNTGTGGSMNFGFTMSGNTATSTTYKVLPQNSRDVTIKFTSLTIGGTSYNNTVTVNASGRAFSAKGNYRITVTLKPNKIIVGGLEWAPGNLKSDFTFYANQSDYDSQRPETNYFGWNTTSTAIGAYNSGNYSTSNDPCQKVIPVGTWRTPSKDELQLLVNAGSTWTTFNGVNGRWFGGVNTGLFLPAAGYRYSDGTMSNVGSFGYYWSSTPSDSSTAYYFYYGTGTGGATSSYDRNRCRSVRCVKG